MSLSAWNKTTKLCLLRKSLWFVEYRENYPIVRLVDLQNNSKYIKQCNSVVAVIM